MSGHVGEATAGATPDKPLTLCPVVAVSNQLTPEQIDAFLDRHKDLADARRFLQDAGLIDEHGELAKPYRPELVANAQQWSALVFSGVS